MWMQNNRAAFAEAEFTHALATFPLAAEPVKVAAFNVCRDVGKGLLK